MARFETRLSDKELLIRPLADYDLPLTMEWRNHDDSRVWFKTSDPIEWNAHLAWFEQYLERPTDYMFIIEENGREVGQMSIYRVEGDTAEVGRLLVAPEHRGRGIMKRALPMLFRFAASLGVCDVRLQVLADNHRALMLYRSIGFDTLGGKGGMLLMGKRLGPYAAAV